MIKSKAILLVVLFVSCSQRVIHRFILVNQTEQDLDSVYVKISDADAPSHFLSIGSGLTSTFNLDMTGIPKTDGDYLLSYKQGDLQKQLRFGYYTNGIPMEEETTILIRQDTLLFQSEANRY